MGAGLAEPRLPRASAFSGPSAVFAARRGNLAPPGGFTRLGCFALRLLPVTGYTAVGEKILVDLVWVELRYFDRRDAAEVAGRSRFLGRFVSVRL